MPVLQKDLQRTEQATNAYRASTAGRKQEHGKTPKDTQRIYTESEMYQDTAQGDRKHAGTQNADRKISVPISRDKEDEATRKNKAQLAEREGRGETERNTKTWTWGGESAAMKARG